MKTSRFLSSQKVEFVKVAIFPICFETDNHTGCGINLSSCENGDTYIYSDIKLFDLWYAGILVLLNEDSDKLKLVLGTCKKA